MKTSIALLLFVAVAQLHATGAFSPLMATKVVAPSKAKAAARKAAPKAATVKKAIVKKTATKNNSKADISKSKAKAILNAKKKADVKDAAKAKAAAKTKANASLRTKAKAADKAKADAAAKAKAKAVAKGKKAAANKSKPKTTTSATAARVANSGTDAALAITKGFKSKNKANKQPLFPGVQASTAKKPASKKKADNAPAKANNVVAKKGGTAGGTVNPIEFGLQVVQSEKGQAAAAILVEGGLKFVEAILEEGKKTKVVIPTGFDAKTGELKSPKVSNVGIRQLIDAGIFAGTEFFDVAKNNYEKFYVGGEAQEQIKITRTPAKLDKKGNVVSPKKDNYVLNIGGERVLINRPAR